MATFLTTPKMSPELARRIEQRLSKRRAKSTFTAELERGRGSALGRALVALAFLAVAGGFYASQASDKRELEDHRNNLLGEIKRRRAELDPRYETLLANVERWSAEAARETETDHVAPQLGDKPARDALLAKPALYVRGGAAELRDVGKIGDAAAESDKDAFLLCLMHPPASRGEDDLLGKVLGVNFGGAVVGDATRNVHRLHEAFVGLNVLGAGFERKVRATQSPAVLTKLAQQLDAIPVELGRTSARAELLIVVADDGPKARATLVDMVHGTVLLHIQRRTDTPRSSVKLKLHATEVSACELALDVLGVP